MKKNILVLAPHMDDEVIGCGGSILKHIYAGNDVSVLFFTDGSNFASEKAKADLLKKNRMDEVIKVMKFLKATPYFLNVPDRTLSYNTRILQEVIKVLQEIQPDIIYVPHIKEGDREHRIVNEIFREAFWLASDVKQLNNGESLKVAEYILEYEVWEPIYNPNYYEDIGAFIDKKCEAIKMYESQKKFFDYAFAIRGLNQYRGAMSHVCYAEAFNVKKDNINLY